MTSMTVPVKVTDFDRLLELASIDPEYRDIIAVSDGNAFKNRGDVKLIRRSIHSSLIDYVHWDGVKVNEVRPLKKQSLTRALSRDQITFARKVEDEVIGSWDRLRGHLEALKRLVGSAVHA